MGTLSNGVYRIRLDDKQYLTFGDQGVSVLHKQGQGQEFQVSRSGENRYAISAPPRMFPSRSLSYQNAENGERVILGPLSDFPTREWEITEHSTPGTFTIGVKDNGKSLVMGRSPIPIFPPPVELAPSNEQGWTFEPVQD